MSGDLSLNFPDHGSNMREPQAHLTGLSLEFLLTLAILTGVNAMRLLVDITLVPDERLNEFSKFVQLVLSSS